jgi:glycosyltransferase involved in cell wall biosynthesis
MNPAIGIDGRMHGHSGIGRYITSFVEHLSGAEKAKTHRFTVFARERFFNDSFLHLITKSRPLSFLEQIELPMKTLGSALDLFHSPQFNVPVLSHLPQVTTIHDCAYAKFPDEFSNRLDRCLYTLMFHLALMKSRKIIAVSEATRDDLVQIYGVSADRIKVIHEGVDRSVFRAPSPEQLGRATCTYGLEGAFLLSVGVPRPRKNIDRILQAFAAVRSHVGGSLKLVMAGPKDTRFLDIRKTAKALGIDQWVIQVGQVTDQELLSLYHAAICLIFPSLYEGFGLPILEAMASGTPVITSRRSAHMEIAGDAALLVNPVDVEELTNAITRVVLEKALREELSQKGLARAREFSWESCAEQTVEVYDEVLNG